MTGDHDHSMQNMPRTRLLIVFSFTFLFMIVEAVVGFIANSLALMADAGHMLNDVISLLLALIAIYLSAKTQTKPSLTYGYKRVEVLSGLLNGVSLIFIAIYIIKEAIMRFINLDKLLIEGNLVIIVGFIGLVLNLIGLRMLMSAKEGSLNIEGAYHHIMADVLGSVAALIAGLGIMLFQAYWLDLAASIVVSLVVLKSGIDITSRSTKILIEATPDHICVDDVKQQLESISGVEKVTDLHTWRVTDGFDLITAHIIIVDEAQHTKIKNEATRIARSFGFHHITFQIDFELCDGYEEGCVGLSNHT